MRFVVCDKLWGWYLLKLVIGYYKTCFCVCGTSFWTHNLLYSTNDAQHIIPFKLGSFRQWTPQVVSKNCIISTQALFTALKLHMFIVYTLQCSTLSQGLSITLFLSFFVLVLMCYDWSYPTVCLRVQSNPANFAEFKGISPERAFGDFIFASVILHLVVMNFIG